MKKILSHILGIDNQVINLRAENSDLVSMISTKNKNIMDLMKDLSLKTEYVKTLEESNSDLNDYLKELSEALKVSVDEHNKYVNQMNGKVGGLKKELNRLRRKLEELSDETTDNTTSD